MTMTMRRLCAGLVLAAGVGWGLPAVAYDADYFSYMADSNMHHVMLSQMSRNAEMARELSRGGGRAARSGTPRAASTRVPLRPPSQVVAQMAARFPASTRSEATRTMQAMLANYSQVERHFGLPPGDVAGPIAAYIAGSYVAYHDTRFPNDNFRPLVTQVRNVISTDPRFQKASVADKQALYEQMAIAGMLMVHSQRSLQGSATPEQLANLRQTGRAGLEQFLRVDADRIRIDAQGLHVR